MPPKVKITKEDIVKTSVELVRSGGEECVNARAIAARLNCSTQPVFSNFETMDELHEALRAEAYRLYLGFIESEISSGKYPKYKAFGMAYIRFAREEKKLFKFLFMCDEKKRATTPTLDFDASVELVMESFGVAREKAQVIQLEMWSFVHGIAAMHATSFLLLEWDLISDMVTDVYQGLRARHLAEEK